MAFKTRAELIDAINDFITTNDNQEITGAVVNNLLKDVVDSLNQGALLFSGMFDASTGELNGDPAGLPPYTPAQAGKMYYNTDYGVADIGNGTMDFFQGDIIIGTELFGYVVIANFESIPNRLSWAGSGALISWDGASKNYYTITPGTTGQVLTFGLTYPEWQDATTLPGGSLTGEILQNTMGVVGWTSTINDTSGVPAISPSIRALTSSVGTTLEWELGYLQVPGGIISLNWQHRQLLDSGGVESMHWGSRTLSDSMANKVLDWSVGRLLDTAGTVIADWLSELGHLTVRPLNFNVMPGVDSGINLTTTTPADIAGGNDYLLGKPPVWIPIKVNGVSYWLPAYDIS